MTSDEAMIREYIRNHVIGARQGFVPDQFACHQNGMALSKHLFLALQDTNHLADLLD